MSVKIPARLRLFNVSASYKDERGYSRTNVNIGVAAMDLMTAASLAITYLRQEQNAEDVVLHSVSNRGPVQVVQPS